MRRIRPPRAENFAAAEGKPPTMVWSCGAEGQVPRFACRQVILFFFARRELHLTSTFLSSDREPLLRPSLHGMLGLDQFVSAIDIGLGNTKWPI